MLASSFALAKLRKAIRATQAPTMGWLYEMCPIRDNEESGLAAKMASAKCGMREVDSSPCPPGLEKQCHAEAREKAEAANWGSKRKLDHAEKRGRGARRRGRGQRKRVHAEERRHVTVWKRMW